MAKGICRILAAGMWVVLALCLVGLAPARAEDPAPQAGEFVGIGIQLDGQPTPAGHIRVAGILEQAGEDVKKAIKVGDQITHVDGKSIQGLPIEDVVKMVRGPEGTTVKLTLQREGEDKPIEASLTRRKIQIGK